MTPLQEFFGRPHPTDDAGWNALATEFLAAFPDKLQIPMTQIGRVKIMHNEGNAAAFDRECHHTGDERFSVVTHGIFPDDSNWAATAKVAYLKEGRTPRDGEQPDGAVYRFWGLTADRKWLRIEAISIFPDTDLGAARRQLPHSIAIMEATSFMEMCEFSMRLPEQVWSRLEAVFG